MRSRADGFDNSEDAPDTEDTVHRPTPADDPDRADETQRRWALGAGRWALEISCLSSAAAFQQPQEVRPTDRVEECVGSAEAQGAPVALGDPAPESRAAWIGAGRDSRGFLTECATWPAAATPPHVA